MYHTCIIYVIIYIYIYTYRYRYVYITYIHKHPLPNYRVILLSRRTLDADPFRASETKRGMWTRPIHELGITYMLYMISIYNIIHIMYIYICVYTSISLSLYTYIYIYMYIMTLYIIYISYGPLPFIDTSFTLAEGATLSITHVEVRALTQ